jgi:uroporphyrin-III C-methyltransferase/precorrin-2 dehydrogenase/sirohydrochlorin ferrochelatase
VDYFPVFMVLQGQRCVVVGGGEVAARKARLLLGAGAAVTIVAPELADSMRELLGAGLTHVQRGYRAADLDGAVLVVAATGERALNAEISRDAHARQLPVNVVDDPELCSIIVPAIVDRAPILIAVGTAGSAPVLARLLRGRIEALVPEQFGQLAQLSAALRGEVRAALPDVQQRRRFWEEVFEGEIAEQVFRGERAAAEAALRAKLAAYHADMRPEPGAIYLIGAGPNDPELVSFRALRCLQRADLVVIAPGVSPVIAQLSRRDAAHWQLTEALSAAADGVMQRLAASVRSGARACVLAPGDAFREPEGAALAAQLAGANLPCVIVPGIPSR